MESLPSTTKSPLIVEVEFAAKQLSLPSIALVTSGPVRPGPPTKVCFADIVSGRLVKSMLNLQ
jgi:hypothetical protein